MKITKQKDFKPISTMTAYRKLRSPKRSLKKALAGDDVGRLRRVYGAIDNQPAATFIADAGVSPWVVTTSAYNNPDAPPQDQQEQAVPVPTANYIVQEGRIIMDDNDIRF